ncbi:hypothetical protein ACFT25_32620 [Streptomyces hydrogenans]|uniref:hypothetical protein n=1 Tax=Streptomyces hydrogenans TaxID=1873719 RepID=UPI0036339698
MIVESWTRSSLSRKSMLKLVSSRAPFIAVVASRARTTNRVYETPEPSPSTVPMSPPIPIARR